VFKKANAHRGLTPLYSRIKKTSLAREPAWGVFFVKLLSTAIGAYLKAFPHFQGLNKNNNNQKYKNLSITNILKLVK
jgi:hypothetical protein